MSRIAKAPIQVPSGVEVSIDGQAVRVKGSIGELSLEVHPAVSVSLSEGVLSVDASASVSGAMAQAGTARSLLSNMVEGVSKGFSKTLLLVGVGYKVQVQGDTVNLNLGFSHAVPHKLRSGVTAKATSPTELVIQGACKQAVGQEAAEVRAYRPPEPYKGKGVRYSNERVVMKETKKK